MRYLIILLAAIVLVNCKNNSANQSSDKPISASVKPVEEQLVISNQKNVSDSLIQVYRTSAIAILENRLKNNGSKSVTGLDKDIWQMDAILKGSDMIFGHNLQGAWIDFKENATYTYGSYSVVNGNGRYHYEVEKSILLMIDNDNRIKPQEFQPMLANDAVVLVGSSIYGDNNMQAKCVRVATLPVKPEPKPEF